MAVSLDSPRPRPMKIRCQARPAFPIKPGCSRSEPHRNLEMMPMPMPNLRLYDAHNHVQDERLAPNRSQVLEEAIGAGVAGMVVNGAAEDDWPLVLELARANPMIIPSFGYHPWYVQERSPQWRETLLDLLEAIPAGVGEIGLDRWMKDYDWSAQQEVFRWQLQAAAERNLPVSIHCLQAWGRLLELLRAGPTPACGFLLHSFGGPAEMIPALTELGAYFSLPGYFAHDRKVRQREAFRCVPPERLLIETDAPDQRLPPIRTLFPLQCQSSAEPINHPANLLAVYQFAAELFGESLESLVARVSQNFHNLFGGLLAKRTATRSG